MNRSSPCGRDEPHLAIEEGHRPIEKIWWGQSGFNGPGLVGEFIEQRENLEETMDQIMIFVDEAPDRASSLAILDEDSQIQPRPRAVARARVKTRLDVVCGSPGCSSEV